MLEKNIVITTGDLLAKYKVVGMTHVRIDAEDFVRYTTSYENIAKRELSEFKHELTSKPSESLGELRRTPKKNVLLSSRDLALDLAYTKLKEDAISKDADAVIKVSLKKESIDVKKHIVELELEGMLIVLL